MGYVHQYIFGHHYRDFYLMSYAALVIAGGIIYLFWANRSLGFCYLIDKHSDVYIRVLGACYRSLINP